jgi:DNA-binding transcriptional ArsR family regulator
MSFTPDVRTVDDAASLRALAHPCRLALLEALAVHGELTATEAADLVGESPANCSWHLRQLAKHGFIEEVPGATGRQRPWRKVGTVMEWHESGADPAADEAARALTRVFMQRQFSLITEAMTRPQPPGWTDAVVATQAIAWLTEDEVRSLEDAVFALMTTHRERLTDPAARPPGARPVRILALGVADDALAHLPDAPDKETPDA